MTDFQIISIVTANSDNLGQNNVNMKKISYSATFADSSHAEGFVMITEPELGDFSINQLKVKVAKQIANNLGGIQ